MKKIQLVIALATTFGIYSCGNNDNQHAEITTNNSEMNEVVNNMKTTKEEISNRIEEKKEEIKEVVSTADAKWDKILDEYEEYMEEYIKMYKKAMSGDASAMTSYASLLTKANSFGTKLEDAKSDNSLSEKQLTRMIKIQSKMLEMAK